MFNVDYSNYNLGPGFKDTEELMPKKGSLSFFYRAIVVNNNDPKKLGRVQVRVPSLHGSSANSANYMPDMLLPWASPGVWSSAGNDMGMFDPPIQGTRVFVAFEGGDVSLPIYFGGIPTKLGKNKVYRADPFVMKGVAFDIDTDDYNLDFVNGTERVPFKSFKGATIIIDDFDGNEYIKIIDQSGQTFTMGNKGDALPRRNGELGVSSQSFMELTNNRGEKVRIEEGKVIIEGDETQINSKKVTIPNWQGGGGSIDAYTKEETDMLLANKSRIFFEQPKVPYQVDDLWYNGTSVYRCIKTKKNGSFSIHDWELDTSYMTPDQVERTVTEMAGKILETASKTYVTPAYVDEKLNYEIIIYSTNGDIFKNDVISTTLTAFVKQGNMDVSTKFKDNQFIWSRVSDDKESDIEWNRKHIGGSRTVGITKADVDQKATFTCELVDEINALNYISTGLIEIFDGYDEPTSTGEWQSMIRTNNAVIPSSGTSYDKDKHGYIFNGTKSGLELTYPIKLIPGYTYEFVSTLQSYTDTQNILSSNADTNDTINNRIACAVAGHLQIRKHGYTMNAGNVKINRKSFVSIRYADEDNVEIYYNGDYAGRFIQSGWTSEPALLTHIGKYCNGIIHSIRVYNRLLTPAEITTNYEQDIERFS